MSKHFKLIRAKIISSILRTPFRKNNAEGFTLIEVLVVVAIIALLVSILLPSLKAAREQGKAVICETQLNQIFKGIFMYTGDYKDTLPHMGYRKNKNLMQYLWFTQINKYVANQLEIYYCTSDREPMKRKVNYNKSRRLKMADANSAPDPEETAPFNLDVSYQGACNLLDDNIRWRFGPANLSPMPRKSTSFKRPGATILLVEGQQGTYKGPRGGGTTDYCMRYEDLSQHVDSRNPSVKRSWRRHNNKSHFLFLDSHVARLSPEQAKKELTRNLEYIIDPLNGN